METLDAIVPPGILSELLVRSETNIRRSRELVAAAHAAGEAARRSWRPKFAGGSDSGESPSPRPVESPQARLGDPRIIRTWTKVKSGALPTDGARRRWVGPGRGERCDGCGDPIGPQETEFEIDFLNALLLQFHVACFHTWERFDGDAGRRG